MADDFPVYCRWGGRTCYVTPTYSDGKLFLQVFDPADEDGEEGVSAT